MLSLPLFLLTKIDLIQESGVSVTLTGSERHLVLEYLLSTGRVENIIGIPLIKLVDGSIIALSKRTDTSPNHILLEPQDHTVFHQFDPQAILITTLPSTAIQYLKSTTLLDVEPLKADHIINYINHTHIHFGLSTATSSSTLGKCIDWVSKFFEWTYHSPLEKVLHGHLHKHPLLPVNGGQFKSISSGVFSPRNTHINHGLVQLLQHLGLPFLYPGISVLAQKYLDPYLKSIDNPHHVLTSLPSLNQHLSSQDVQSLQDYILSHKWTIQGDQVILAILRTLPIYSHMEPTNPSLSQSNSMTNYLTSWSSIPGSVEIKVVAPDVTLLPIVPDTFFTSHLSLVQILDQNLKVTSTIDIFLHNFQSQPPDLQARFLDQLTTMHIPSHSLSPLRSIPSILGADGQLHAPQVLVDPTSKLAGLLPPDSPHLPQYQTTLQHRMINSLRSLSLLPNTLTMDIFQEIVGVIMNKQDTQLSRSLLDFLDDDTQSWSISNLLPNHQWLETTHGLSSPAHSYDHRFAELCNHVRPLLKGARRVRSQKLLHALHWDTPPTIQVVTDQFKALVSKENPSCPELLPVTSFLGSHLGELSNSGQLQELKQFVKGKSWVPTYGYKLTSTTLAIFQQDHVILPFKQIRSQFADNKDARSFLQAMGCMEK